MFNIFTALSFSIRLFLSEDSFIISCDFLISGVWVTVTIYNLPKSLKNYIKNGYKCYIYAGFISETGENNTVGKVFVGKISGLTANTYNAGDEPFQFTVNDNSDNTNEAEVKKKTVTKVRTVSAEKTLDETITKYNSKLNAQRRKWIDDHPNDLGKNDNQEVAK